MTEHIHAHLPRLDHRDVELERLRGALFDRTAELQEAKEEIERLKDELKEYRGLLYPTRTEGR